MKCVILSHFDNVLGPRVFMKIPENNETNNYHHITALMDLDEEGFSIHETDQYRSANRIFTVPNQSARGGHETLQLSVVVDVDTKINLNFVRKLLTDYSKRINRIKDCHKAFKNNDRDKDDEQVYQELKKVFKRFYKSVHPIVEILKEADKRLEESEKRYRELVENVNSIILKWDFDGKILFINKYGEKFTGYNRKELIGKNVIGTLVPESGSSGENSRALITSIKNNPEKHKKNINENITRDGSKVIISWTNSGLRDEKGQLIGILSVGNDISDAEKVEN